jgi:hypothetical protein
MAAGQEEIEFRGIDEVARLFSVTLPNNLQESIDQSLTDIANDIHNTTTSLCPVDTGALLGSIRVTRTTANQIIATAGEDYASYVDSGTRKMEAQPFFVDPINNIVDLYPEKLSSNLDKLFKV